MTAIDTQGSTPTLDALVDVPAGCMPEPDDTPAESMRRIASLAFESSDDAEIALEHGLAQSGPGLEGIAAGRGLAAASGVMDELADLVIREL